MSALSNVELTSGLQGTKMRSELVRELPLSVIGVFTKNVPVPLVHSRLLLRAGSIVAAKTVRFTPNAAFGNELGWGQGGVPVVLLKDVNDGDVSVLVRQQDESDGRLTFSGDVVEVLASSIRQVEWHNVRRGNLNCYQGVTWGCAQLTQPLVLTWVASKRGNIEDDEGSSTLGQPMTSNPLFATPGIREFVERMPKPIGHYDTVSIPLTRMAQWMSNEQYAHMNVQADTDFELMIVNIIPDKCSFQTISRNNLNLVYFHSGNSKKQTTVFLTNWSQVFDSRLAPNFEDLFLRNLVCLQHGPFEHELFELGATILDLDASEHPVAHFLFLEAVSHFILFSFTFTFGS